VGEIASVSFAKNILGKSEGTVDATMSQARSELQTGVKSFIHTQDNFNYPIETDIEKRITSTTGPAEEFPRVDQRKNHPDGRYHIFKHIPSRGRYNNHEYTVAIVPDHHPFDHDDSHTRTTGVEIHRFRKKEDLSDWIYNDQRFNHLEEAEFWHDVLVNLDIDSEPVTDPIEKLTEEAVAYVYCEEESAIDIDDWESLDNFNPETVSAMTSPFPITRQSDSEAESVYFPGSSS
jgi:hypothetical protein